MSRATSGSTATWKSTSSRVAKYCCFAQSGFAMVIFCAEKRGQGTQRFQPVSPGERSQPTFRSPVM